VQLEVPEQVNAMIDRILHVSNQGSARNEGIEEPIDEPPGEPEKPER
jgi:hypothetical protein